MPCALNKGLDLGALLQAAIHQQDAINACVFGFLGKTRIAAPFDRV